MSERFASCKYSDFNVVEELYRSQAGAVYRATFKYDHKDYVLKERKLPKSKNPKDIMNEVKLLIQLHHHNVIRCEGWFREDSRSSIFIVLEFCGGGDLNALVQNQRKKQEYFDEHIIWSIFYQLCCGLRHLHEHGIIHRDLKPLNILISASGRTFKIGDLGVSRQLSEETLLVKSFYGTPLYLSPELVENKPYNEKTDIWSLGVILYEMCCLQPPFQGNTLLEVAKMVSTGKYPPLPRKYSSHLHRCVAWMLQLDYTKRPNVVQVQQFVEARLGKDENKPAAEAALASAVARGTGFAHRASVAGSDTESEGSGVDEDSLDGRRPRRDRPDSFTAAAAARDTESGTRPSTAVDMKVADRGRDRGRGMRRATPPGSDDDTVSEGEDQDVHDHVRRPHKGTEPRRSTKDRMAAASAAAATQPAPVPRAGHAPEPSQPRADLPSQGSAVDEAEVQQPKRVQEKYKLPVQVPINEKKKETDKGRRAAKKVDEGELVTADLQRVQVLLRRETAALRRLLQLRDFVAPSPEAGAPEHAGADSQSVPQRIAAASLNVQALEQALFNGGKMAAEIARRFNLVVEGEQPAALAQPASLPKSPSAGQVPVTRLPLRPGEAEVLGVDINCDRKGHSRHLLNPSYFPSRPEGRGGRPATAGARLAVPAETAPVPDPAVKSAQTEGDRDFVGRPILRGAARVVGHVEAPPLRKSPERKQVGQGELELRYQDKRELSHPSGAPDVPNLGRRKTSSFSSVPVGDAAGKGIGQDAAARQAKYQQQVGAVNDFLFLGLQKQSKEIDISTDPDPHAPRTNKLEASKATDALLLALPLKTVAVPERTEYRIFDEHSDRRRPHTAKQPRFAAKDVNEERKERLWAKWESAGAGGGSEEGGGGGGCGILALPSVVAGADKKQRPRSAHPAGRSEERPQQRREQSEDPAAKYVDIMDLACRAIADKIRRPAHRRLKSDVTNPGYELPPPRQPSRHNEQVVVPAPQVPPPACADPPRARGIAISVGGRRGKEGERGESSHEKCGEDGEGGEEELSPSRYPKGAYSREQFLRDRGPGTQDRAIKLRGAGHYVDGELLPEERRLLKDSAFRLISGK